MLKISVLMTVFNAESMLEESIKSILNQTYEDFELIIVNDGSSDNSEKIIKEISNGDRRIIFINRVQNKGRVYSLNEGLSFCTGDWIAINDADDISRPNRLKQLYDFIMDNNLIDKFGVVGSASKIIYLKEKKYKNYYVKYGNIGHKRVSKFRIFYSMPFVHSSFIYNAKALHEIDGFSREVTAGIDYLTLLKITNQYPIYALNEILVDRYIDGNNFFLQEKMKSQSKKNEKIIHQWLKMHYKEYYGYYCLKKVLNFVVPRKNG